MCRTPNVSDGVKVLAEAGATKIVVLPYFLAPGTHVIDDMPELIAAAEKNYPAVSFTVAQHLGGVDGIIGLILESASKS